MRRDRLRPAPQPIGPTPFLPRGPSLSPWPLVPRLGRGHEQDFRQPPRSAVYAATAGFSANHGQRSSSQAPSATARCEPSGASGRLAASEERPAPNGPVGEETLGAPSSIPRRSRHACSAFAAGPSPTQLGGHHACKPRQPPGGKLQDQAALPSTSESPAKDQASPGWRSA